MSSSELNRPVPRWVHAWAILTAAATLPLLGLGGLVTTRDVGMSDPVWPTTPWYLFFASWQEPRPGFFIEHTHRFFGYIVGILTIVLAVALWRTARVKSLRWLGIVCLLGVSLQGVLGGVRVVLNEVAGRQLAATHGVSAQVVFCLLVSAAFLTRPVRRDDVAGDAERDRCRPFAFLLVGLVFTQLIFGSLVRHNPTGTAQRLHLFTAFLVVGSAVWLLRAAGESPGLRRETRADAKLLGAFLFVQVALGVEAWMGKFASGVLPQLQHLTTGQVVIRTAHVLVGTGIFATSVVLALRCSRRAVISEDVSAPAPHNITTAAPVAAGTHSPGGSP